MDSKNGTWLRGGLRLREIVTLQDVTVEIGATSLMVRMDADALELPLSDAESFGDAIGSSPAMRHLFAMLERAASSEVSVLLEGESGVGKEVLAQALHRQSARRDGPFVPVDCGAIPAALIESELFGHERGAFTGAVRSQVGLFEQAHGGTIFLDEVGELPLDLQPKLLRVLEQREVRPVGARAAKSVDVRVVAATHRRLADASEKGEFRRDLYYRLAVARLKVPPLRERGDDVLVLARRFLKRLNGDADVEVPTELEALLRSYSWPGNVRELRNVVERYVLLGLRDRNRLLDADQHQPKERNLALLPYHEARTFALERFEREYFPALMVRAGGVLTRAAQMADLARPSLYRILDRLQIPRGER
jgi:DNA-binding NtrC family response regulator